MTTRTRTLLAALTATLAIAAPAHADPTQTGCDPIDPSACMLPFPNDFFTKADPSTKTGRRVDLNPLAMPRNVAGRPIDPTDWNRADGFSPGSLIVVKVPGMDSDAAYAQTGPVPVHDIGAYRDRRAPVVVLDVTGRKPVRWPVWTELDHSIDKLGGTDADRTLLIRPARNFLEGHRYVVALRGMKAADGKPIAAPAAFAAYRDGTATDARAQHFDDIFSRLARARIARRDLYLAWDFTVASGDSIASRMLHIRDDAFAQLGDTNLADRKVEGKAPTFTLQRVVDMTCDARRGTPLDQDAIVVDTSCPDQGDAKIAYDVKGTMDVPCYLSTPGCAPAHSQFVLDPATGMPQQIPGNTYKVDFECRIPQWALDHPGESRPSLYGHGLFGGYGEIHQGQLTDFMAEHGLTFCATDWAGMATVDVPNVVSILTDLSNFNTLADRVQQGMLDFLYLGRLMIHPDGLCSQPPFQTADGGCILDTRRLFYDGNSQGGIIGGALTAVAPDFDRATLGVLGMNYSTLLTRSTDFGTGEHGPGIIDHPTEYGPDNPPDEGAVLPDYAWPLYESYPQLNERQLIFSLMQMLWDRAEPDGYAQHMTTDPYPNTPPHQVLLMAGYGDHQVSNVAAEVEARTIGARVLRKDMLPAGRSWERDPWWGLKAVDLSDPEQTRRDSVLTVWDGGSRPSPLGNVAQDSKEDDDPHEWVRRTPWARDMKSAFLSVDGRIVDTCAANGGFCRTYNYPYEQGAFADESPLAGVATGGGRRGR